MIIRGKRLRFIYIFITRHQAHRSLAANEISRVALEMLAKTSHRCITFYNKYKGNSAHATLSERTQEDNHYEKVWSGMNPLGKQATFADIAKAALFLVSNEARHITG